MTKQLRLCVVIPSFYPATVYGGWVYSSLNTCRELSKLGVKNYISTTNDNGGNAIEPNPKHYKRLFDNIFVKYYKQTIRERLSLGLFTGLFADIRRADIVHIQGIFSQPTPLGLFYATLLGKKIILSPHGCMGEWCLADGSRFKKPFLFLGIKPFANLVTWHVTSEQEKKEIEALYSKAQIEIIPNGIYVDEFAHVNPIAKSDFVAQYTGVNREVSHVVITMARLHKKKGLDILIRAFQTTVQQFPNAVLLIAGQNFGEQPLLESLVDSLGIRNNVFFIGHIEGQNRVDFFGNADLFALSSHNENFGLVFAEAMASGTPIVASQNTPWEEVETLGIGKWVANTPEATSEAIIAMLSSDCKALGEKAKTFVAQNYSWQSIGYQFNALFAKLLG